jgi:hypothetical protein
VFRRQKTAEQKAPYSEGKNQQNGRRRIPKAIISKQEYGEIPRNTG